MFISTFYIRIRCTKMETKNVHLKHIVTFVYIIFILSQIVVSDLLDGTTIMDHYVSLYGEGYGTEWIYFPDGEGHPHYVTLSGHDVDYNTKTRALYSEIEYRLYTTNNTEDAVLLNESAIPLIEMKNVELASLPLKIITHGWRSSAEGSAVSSIKDAYIKTSDVNIITVDWSYTAGSIFYHWVANQTLSIGTEIAIFLKSLCERYNVTGDNIHLIGHSLGAHVMGIAAYQSNITIRRITGLDPARPLFEYPSRDESAKLDSSDAKFVDVIHTCGGILGIEGAIGTADFFPNSGIPPQPGCDTIPKILEACSHGRSIIYFAESITTPQAFPAYQCRNWTEYLENKCRQYGYMGEKVSEDISGSFYLKTNSKQPFGRISY